MSKVKLLNPISKLIAGLGLSYLEPKVAEALKDGSLEEKLAGYAFLTYDLNRLICSAKRQHHPSYNSNNAHCAFQAHHSKFTTPANMRPRLPVIDKEF